MRETTDIRGYLLTPEGEYFLTVSRPPQKNTSSSGISYYRWWFKTKLKGISFNVAINLFPSECRELLLALGGEEKEPGKIEWDNEAVVNKTIKAEIYHNKDKKGMIWEKIRNVKQVVLKRAEGAEASLKAEEPIDWEE